MTHRLAVIDTVAVTPQLLPLLPSLHSLPARPLLPVFPAVTCPVQASMLTGVGPERHGVVGNGWLDPELREVRFWKQSAGQIRSPRVWDTLKRTRPAFKVANLFWWFNMATTCDVTVTPRPQYLADGRKVPDIATVPGGLRDQLQERLGRFPLFRFWGPGAGIASSRWIAEATHRVGVTHAPDLLLSYLPHLDYDLQRFGPDPAHPRVRRACAELDTVLSTLFDRLNLLGYKVWVVNEYAIERTRGVVPINRLLREAGLLRVRAERGGEHLDPDNSLAFAVADHQAAHVYHPRLDRLPLIPRTRQVELTHPRAGETVLTADRGHWFTYDWWLEDRCAPDYARTVDIHRKPGYDPRELFSRVGRLGVGRRLLARKLGSRRTLDVVPLDPHRVGGTHGRPPDPDRDALPLWLGGEAGDTPLPCTALHDRILRFFGG